MPAPRRYLSYAEYAEEDPEFKNALNALKTFVERVAAPSMRNRRCFRVVSERELELWKKYGGFRPELSYFGRFVCAYNPYIPWMDAHGMHLTYMTPPGSVVAMLEVELGSPERFYYSDLVVGRAPCFTKETATLKGEKVCDHWLGTDALVSQKDLLFAEGYSREFVRPEKVRRLYVLRETDGVRSFVEWLREKNPEVEIIGGIPEPDEETAQAIRSLYGYLRSLTACVPRLLSLSGLKRESGVVFADTRFAMLAEAYDDLFAAATGRLPHYEGGIPAASLVEAMFEKEHAWRYPEEAAERCSPFVARRKIGEW